MEYFLYLTVWTAAFFTFKTILRLAKPRPPLPPGPKPLPIIGNYLQVPRSKEWLTIDRWFKEHGDMVYYSIFGQGVLALGSMKRCHDLFEKRSRIYSSRPDFVMLNRLCGWDFSLPTLPYGSWWRRRRQAVHQYFNMNVISKYRPVQLKSSRDLMLRLLNPEGVPLSQNLRSCFADIIMEVLYGYKVARTDDPYIAITELAMTALLEAAKPGKFLVEIFPFLRYVPSWVPGAGFKKKAEKWKAATISMVDDPFQWVKSEMTKGRARPSIASSMIEKISEADIAVRDELEVVMKDAAGIAFAAASDSTIAAVEVFILAMAMHPEIQKAAQLEIDSVLENQRLPEFSDRESLPYVNAIIKETMRWQTIVPINTPHLSTEDDVYEGYFIPKGTMVLGANWSILHDPDTYTDPFKFKPERFIKDGKFDHSVLDPYAAAFGHGRRICPGRYFADDTAFILISSILTIFNISAPLDGDGNPRELSCDMTDGLVSHPKDFDCIITPRSEAAAQLLRDNKPII